MKYSLDCFIKTDNDGIRNAVKQLIPDVTDPRIWDSQYDHTEEENIDGLMYFYCSVRFNLKSERDSITASIKDLAGVIDSCEVGSFVREHKCHHDETPQKPCEEETMLRKS